MGSVKIEKIGGMLPAWDDRNLPDSQAAFSENTFVYGGTAIGWRVPKLLHALSVSTSKFAYRIPVITQANAQAYGVFLGNPNDGDQVLCGEITYTFRNSPSQPYDIGRGSTTAYTAQALFMALNYGTFDTSVVGPNTAANPAIANACPVIGFPFAFTNTSSVPGANTVVLVKIVPSATMKLTDVKCQPATNAGAAKFKGVVYENVNQINAAGTAFVDIPSSLIATGTEAVGASTAAPVISTFTVPVTLQEGATYWIGFILDTAVALAQSTVGTAGVSMANTYTNGAPNPFVTTTLSGVTVGGTTVGSLQTRYNQSQPSWQIWGDMVVINANDPINSIGTSLVGGTGPYNFLQLQAPSFGTAYNLTPVANVNGTQFAWLKDLGSFADTTTTFVGGANQTSDPSILGNSLWLEFDDQDTNVLRTPVVDDTFQRYYIASPSQPPQYNTYQRIAASQPNFYLGVPQPPIPPTVTVATASGGNATQVGYPNSAVAGNYTVAGQPLNGLGAYTDTLFLFPITLTKNMVLNDIAVQVIGIANVSAGLGNFNITGVIFADASATSTAATNVPGNLIQQGSTVTITDSTFTGPQSLTSTFNPVNLTAGSQYWVGVLMQSLAMDTQIAIGGSDKQGYTASVTSTPAGIQFPKDAVTGGNTAPPIGSFTLKQPSIQMWGDLTLGTTGQAQLETRAYVYTWVTAYGEEGPPSNPTLLDAYDNATWTIGVQPPLAQDLGVLRNIVQTNIYRTMSSKDGGTVFFFVGSISANASTFVDQVTDDVVAGNLILPSSTWFGPPTALQGIVSMPNGMFAGFRGNEVWFSEPFRPHAWPPQYVMTTDFPIVGLGVVGTSLVACTTRNPHVFIGASPDKMAEIRITLPEPCLSRGSILSADDAVYYQSANGLVKVAAAGYANNVTQQWITREKWAQNTPQKFLRATKNGSSYFAFGSTGVSNGVLDNSVAQVGLTLELSEIADAQSFSVWPQVGGHRLGFHRLRSHLPTDVDNVLTDPWTGITLLVSSHSVYFYDFTDAAPTITKVIWRSKKFQGPHRDNFAAFRVWFDIPPGGPQSPPATRTTLPATNTPPTTAAMPFTAGMFGIVRIIADGTYLTERELRYSTELMRVSSQQKYTTWQIEYEGVVKVTNIKMATTVKELGHIK